MVSTLAFVVLHVSLEFKLHRVANTLHQVFLSQMMYTYAVTDFGNFFALLQETRYVTVFASHSANY